MAFWVSPLYYGMEPGTGTGRVVPLYTEKDIMVPAHTKTIQILTDELSAENPPISVWPDVAQGAPSDASVVVMNMGGEYSMAASARQRRMRNIGIMCNARTSDAAERLAQKCAMIVRRSPNLDSGKFEDQPGGYDTDSQNYYRGFVVDLVTKL